MKKIYLLLLVLATVFVACKKDMDVEFSTFEVENEKISPSYTSTELSCKVRCAATINQFYLQYDTVADFSTYQEVELVEDEKTEVYSVKIEDLLVNTTYYVRYVAVNSYSQVTSEVVSEFKTLQATAPTIEVREIKDVLDTIATVSFVLKFNGGADVTKVGVCWSMDSLPTIEDKYVECSRDAINCVSDGDSLVLKISGLEANTTYYVRAYAENMKGVGYSGSKEFVTLTLPEVKTEDVTDIQLTSGWLNGLVLFNGNDTTTEYGFCWGEEENLTIEDSQNVKAEVAEDSTFTYRLSNLQDETKYYVRAYAKNKIGLVYGDVKEFTTQSTILAVVVTAEALDVTYTSAKVGGKVEADGGSDVTERGICYSITKSPTIENEKVVLGTGLGSFTTELSDLQNGTKYYVRAYAINKKGVSYGETVEFETLSRFVDLGLSVKWATCNVGATTPEEYGDYFAWGEVEPKTTYNWSTYKYGSDYNQLTKYCSKSNYGKDGFTDNKTVLDPEDDAATANWGSAWRMPTKAEQDELRNNCTWDWTTQNGVNGYKVTGLNGNSIFLPAAGYMIGGSLYLAGSNGYYWSSSLLANGTYYAYFVFFGSDYVDWSYYDRGSGRSVRPVYGDVSLPKEKYTISVYSNDNSRGTVSGGGTYDEGCQVTITATANSGYRFKEWNDGNTDNPRVITVTKDAIYTAHFEAEKNLNAGHEYVDLGLSVKWATCNVGATKPEDYGDYFAWGEVEPKTTYNWSTYKYSKESYKTMTKYCNNSSYGNGGFTDNKTVLDPEDDAATANWGGTWRMPTKAEQDELRNNCTWDWTTQNGVRGYKVTGPNGNSIFLPAAGCMYGGALYGAGSDGYYWSSSLYADSPDLAYGVNFGSGYVVWNDDDRYYGLSVRPVCH